MLMDSQPEWISNDPAASNTRSNWRSRDLHHGVIVTPLMRQLSTKVFGEGAKPRQIFCAVVDLAISPPCADVSLSISLRSRL